MIPTWKDIYKDTSIVANGNSKGNNNTPVATGYWKLVNQYIDAGYVPIAICGSSPDWYKGLQYKKLAPKYQFFMAWKNGHINNDGYVRAYYEQVLSFLDPHAVYNELCKLGGDKRVVLCCYEKPQKFCHRHIVSYWIRNNINTHVAEFVLSDAQFMSGLLSR